MEFEARDAPGGRGSQDARQIGLVLAQQYLGNINMAHFTNALRPDIWERPSLSAATIESLIKMLANQG